MQADRPRRRGLSEVQLVWLLSTLLLGAFFLPYVVKFCGGLSDDQGVWGQFGDYFSGALNPFLNIATLVFVAYSLRYSKYVYEATKNQLASAESQLELQKRSEQKSRAIAMIQIWNSEHLVRSRIDAWDWYEQNRRGGKRAEAYLMRESDDPVDRKAYRFHGLVWHFFVDLYLLLKAEQIDNELTQSVFMDEFSSWFEMWQGIDFVKADRSPKDEAIFAWHENIRRLAKLWNLTQ